MSLTRNISRMIRKIVNSKSTKPNTAFNKIDFLFPYRRNFLEDIQRTYGFHNKVVYEIGADIDLECAQAALLLGAKCVYAANPDIAIGKPLRKNLTVLKGLGEDTSLEDEKFDLIYGFALLEHVLNPCKLANEVHRLLKDGGNAYLAGWPMWTSQDGNHVWMDTKSTTYRHGSPYFDNWYHLTCPSLEEFREHMLAKKMPDGDILPVYNRAFMDTHISRLSTTEIINAFKNVRGLEVSVIRHYTEDSANEYYNIAKSKYSEEDLRTRGITLHITKSKLPEARHFEYFSTNPSESDSFILSIAAFFISENDNVIDVGANNGIYTEFLAKLVGDKGNVYAFEAVPQFAENIRNKFSDNPSIKIINKAVTNNENANKDISFHYVRLPEKSGFSGIRRCNAIQDDWDVEPITIPSTSLDLSIDERENISFIKVDVEGGDFDVLKGAKRILTESRPLVVFEFGGKSASEVYGYSMDEFFRFFERINYSLYKFTGGKFNDCNEKPVYRMWELWAVAKDTQHEYFFKKNISSFADIWINIDKRMESRRSEPVATLPIFVDRNKYPATSKQTTPSVHLTTDDKLMEPHRSVRKFGIQILLTGHCNKGCRGCAVFSPLSKEMNISFESVEKDFKRVSDLCMKETETVNLIGGEPLLHPQLTSFFSLTRKYFPESRIPLVTNGILLMKQDTHFWKEMRENKIMLCPTKYDDMPWNEIEKKARDENVELEYWGMSYTDSGEMIPKHTHKYTMDPTGSQRLEKINDCPRSEHHMYTVQDGKIYLCSLIPTIKYFNTYFDQKFEVCNQDFLNLHEIQNFDEIIDYVSKPVPFCRYCDVKNYIWNLPYQRTKKELSEWISL